jgi:hypothetical protein
VVVQWCTEPPLPHVTTTFGSCTLKTRAGARAHTHIYTHTAHITQRARTENEVLIISIFVNPIVRPALFRTLVYV